jgi:hypothetical protein
MENNGAAGRRSSTRSEKRDDKNAEASCARCKVTFRKKDKCLQCELCELWYHASCEDVNDAKFELLQDPTLHWYCALSCNRVATKYLSNLAHVDERISGIADAVQKISEGEFPPKMAEALGKLVGQRHGGVMDEKFLRDAVRGEVKEALLREQRKMNLVVKNLPEEGQDVQALDQLVQAMGLSEDWQGGWGHTHRVGKKKNEKGRPLIVTCRDSNQRTSILSHCRKLAQTPTYREVFISRDLTRMEQGEQRELRRRLKQLRDQQDGKKYAIRKGEVVEVQGGATGSKRDDGDDSDAAINDQKINDLDASGEPSQGNLKKD